MRQLSLVIAAHPNTPPIFEWREYLRMNPCLVRYTRQHNLSPKRRGKTPGCTEMAATACQWIPGSVLAGASPSFRPGGTTACA